MLHSLAMAAVVGTNVAFDLRLLGVAKGVALPAMGRLFPVLWIGTVVIVLSGLSLLLAYPAKALTNPVFYLKLSCLICALIISRRLQLGVFTERVNQPKLTYGVTRLKSLAALSLTLWLITVTAGRFLAYTHSVLLASRLYG